MKWRLLPVVVSIAVLGSQLAVAQQAMPGGGGALERFRIAPNLPGAFGEATAWRYGIPRSVPNRYSVPDGLAGELPVYLPYQPYRYIPDSPRTGGLRDVIIPSHILEYLRDPSAALTDACSLPEHRIEELADMRSSIVDVLSDWPAALENFEENEPQDCHRKQHAYYSETMKRLQGGS